MGLDVDLAVMDDQIFKQDILWRDINSFIKQEFKATPSISDKKYSAKPGWNVKYEKSGQMICTLYPEEEGFSALVVVPTDMVPLLEALHSELEKEILETLKSAIPLNNTLWLMIRVNSPVVLKSVKQLLQLKKIICG